MGKKIEGRKENIKWKRKLRAGPRYRKSKGTRTKDPEILHERA